jgi:hypothetical protein
MRISGAASIVRADPEVETGYHDTNVPALVPQSRLLHAFTPMCPNKCPCHVDCHGVDTATSHSEPTAATTSRLSMGGLVFIEHTSDFQWESRGVFLRFPSSQEDGQLRNGLPGQGQRAR